MRRPRRFLTLTTLTVGNGLDGFSTQLFCFHGSSLFDVKTLKTSNKSKKIIRTMIHRISRNLQSKFIRNV